jgi:hypothetical protein
MKWKHKSREQVDVLAEMKFNLTCMIIIMRQDEIERILNRNVLYPRILRILSCPILFRNAKPAKMISYCGMYTCVHWVSFLILKLTDEWCLQYKWITE